MSYLDKLLTGEGARHRGNNPMNVGVTASSGYQQIDNGKPYPPASSGTPFCVTATIIGVLLLLGLAAVAVFTGIHGADIDTLEGNVTDLHGNLTEAQGDIVDIQGNITVTGQGTVNTGTVNTHDLSLRMQSFEQINHAASGNVVSSHNLQTISASTAVTLTFPADLTPMVGKDIKICNLDGKAHLIKQASGATWGRFGLYGTVKFSSQIGCCVTFTVTSPSTVILSDGPSCIEICTNDLGTCATPGKESPYTNEQFGSFTVRDAYFNPIDDSEGVEYGKRKSGQSWLPPGGSRPDEANPFVHSLFQHDGKYYAATTAHGIGGGAKYQTHVREFNTRNAEILSYVDVDTLNLMSEQNITDIAADMSDVWGWSVAVPFDPSEYPGVSDPVAYYVRDKQLRWMRHFAVIGTDGDHYVIEVTENGKRLAIYQVLPRVNKDTPIWSDEKVYDVTTMTLSGNIGPLEPDNFLQLTNGKFAQILSIESTQGPLIPDRSVGNCHTVRVKTHDVIVAGDEVLNTDLVVLDAVRDMALYVTQETISELQVIDIRPCLTGDPLIITQNAFSPSNTTYDFGADVFPFNGAHNLYVDEVAGRLYAMGAQVSGTQEFDVRASPYALDIVRVIQLPIEFRGRAYQHDWVSVHYSPDEQQDKLGIPVENLTYPDLWLAVGSSESRWDLLKMNNGPNNAIWVPQQGSDLLHSLKFRRGQNYAHQAWLTTDKRFVILSDELEPRSKEFNGRFPIAKIYWKDGNLKMLEQQAIKGPFPTNVHQGYTRSNRRICPEWIDTVDYEVNAYYNAQPFEDYFFGSVYPGGTNVWKMTYREGYDLTSDREFDNPFDIEFVAYAGTSPESMNQFDDREWSNYPFCGIEIPARDCIVAGNGFRSTRIWGFAPGVVNERRLGHINTYKETLYLLSDSGHGHSNNSSHYHGHNQSSLEFAIWKNNYLHPKRGPLDPRSTVDRTLRYALESDTGSTASTRNVRDPGEPGDPDVDAGKGAPAFFTSSDLYGRGLLVGGTDGNTYTVFADLSFVDRSIDIAIWTVIVDPALIQSGRIVAPAVETDFDSSIDELWARVSGQTVHIRGSKIQSDHNVALLDFEFKGSQGRYFPTDEFFGPGPNIRGSIVRHRRRSEIVTSPIPAKPGDSGSPLINPAGRLVGILRDTDIEGSSFGFIDIRNLVHGLPKEAPTLDATWTGFHGLWDSGIRDGTQVDPADKLKGVAINPRNGRVYSCVSATGSPYYMGAIEYSGDTVDPSNGRAVIFNPALGSVQAAVAFMGGELYDTAISPVGGTDQIFETGLGTDGFRCGGCKVPVTGDVSNLLYGEILRGSLTNGGPAIVFLGLAGTTTLGGNTYDLIYFELITQTESTASVLDPPATEGFFEDSPQDRQQIHPPNGANSATGPGHDVLTGEESGVTVTVWEDYEMLTSLCPTGYLIDNDYDKPSDYLSRPSVTNVVFWPLRQPTGQGFEYRAGGSSKFVQNYTFPFQWLIVPPTIPPPPYGLLGIGIDQYDNSKTPYVTDALTAVEQRIPNSFHQFNPNFGEFVLKIGGYPVDSDTIFGVAARFPVGSTVEVETDLTGPDSFYAGFCGVYPDLCLPKQRKILPKLGDNLLDFM